MHIKTRTQITITFIGEEATQVKRAYEALQKGNWTHLDIYRAGLERLRGVVKRAKGLVK